MGELILKWLVKQIPWLADKYLDGKAGRTSLVIDKNPYIVDLEKQGFPYKICSITVKNTGKNSAEKCTCYIVTDRQHQLCWEGGLSTVEINPDDQKEIDFCALLNQEIPASFPFPEYLGEEPPEDLSGLPKAIAPNKNGWPNTTEEFENWPAKLTAEEYTVRITASNADPVSAKIQVNYDEQTIKFI